MAMIPSCSRAMIMVPMTVPLMEAMPPAMEVPPITQLAMASLLKVSPRPGCTVVYAPT